MQRKIGDTEESFWEWKSWQRASANGGVGKISPQNVFYRSIFFTNKQIEKRNPVSQNKTILIYIQFFIFFYYGTIWFSVVIQIYNTTCNRRKEIISKHSKKVNN